MSGGPKSPEPASHRLITGRQDISSQYSIYGRRGSLHSVDVSALMHR
ncbi:MAG: hypothetical protein ACR2P9_03250 [Gammaproteobacteria bacterium]